MKKIVSIETDDVDASQKGDDDNDVYKKPLKGPTINISSPVESSLEGTQRDNYD